MVELMGKQKEMKEAVVEKAPEMKNESNDSKARISKLEKQIEYVVDLMGKQKEANAVAPAPLAKVEDGDTNQRIDKLQKQIHYMVSLLEMK